MRPSDIRSYLSVLEYSEFLHSYDTDRLQRIREGLERAVREDPGFAEAFACLSMMETNAERFGSQPVDKLGGRLGQAIELAKRAIHACSQFQPSPPCAGHGALVFGRNK